MSESEQFQFGAKVGEDGRFTPDEANRVHGRLARWKGKHVLVTVSRWVKPKTLPQLAYYFSTILPTWAEYAGEYEREWHRELKRAFLPAKVVVSKLTGEERHEVASLKDQTSEQMSGFINRCLEESAKQGLYIPGPGDEL